MNKKIVPIGVCVGLVWGIPVFGAETTLGTSLGNLHKVEAVEDLGNSYRIVTDQGGLYMMVEETTPTTRYGAEVAFSLEEIAVGDEVYAWYDRVAESYPAQTYVTKLMVVAGNVAGTEIMVNGVHVDQTSVKKDGVTYVPLRKTATAMGCDVSWNGSERSATIKNELRTMTFVAGQDLYVSTAAKEGMVGMTAPMTLGASPYVGTDGVFYVPAEALSALVGFTVLENETGVVITAQT